MYLSGASFEGDDPLKADPKHPTGEVWCVADTLRAEYLDKVEDRHVQKVHGMSSRDKSVGFLIPCDEDGSPGKEEKSRKGQVQVFVQKMKLVKMQREQKVKAYSTLFEHMTGFA